MNSIGSLATWWFWAYYAAGLTVMTGTLVIHLSLGGPLPRHSPWLVAAGGACGALGSFVGGLQAGRYPPLTVAHGVAVVRLFWVGGITLGIVASALYLWGLKEKRV